MLPLRCPPVRRRWAPSWAPSWSSLQPTRADALTDPARLPSLLPERRQCCGARPHKVRLRVSRRFDRELLSRGHFLVGVAVGFPRELGIRCGEVSRPKSLREFGETTQGWAMPPRTRTCHLTRARSWFTHATNSFAISMAAAEMWRTRTPHCGSTQCHISVFVVSVRGYRRRLHGKRVLITLKTRCCSIDGYKTKPGHS